MIVSLRSSQNVFMQSYDCLRAKDYLRAISL